MKPISERPAGELLSRTVSYIFHPFLMPVWLLLMLFGTGILPMYLPRVMKNYILTVVIVDTLIVPALAVCLMKMLGLIRDYSLSTRHDRMLPMLAVALCYGVCAWMLGSAPMLFLLRRMMLAALLCIVFAFAVNLRWQISLHMTAMGAAVGMVSLLLYAGYNVVWIFCGGMLCAGMLASARLYLGKHDPAQVAAGFAGGFIIAALVLLFWI